MKTDLSLLNGLLFREIDFLHIGKTPASSKVSSIFLRLGEKEKRRNPSQEWSKLSQFPALLTEVGHVLMAEVVVELV